MTENQTMIASNFASRSTRFEWCLVVVELSLIVLEPTKKPSKNQHELSERHDFDAPQRKDNDELGSLGHITRGEF